MKKFCYNVERTENCILIDATNWIKNDSNLLQTYKISGKTPVNYMTEVLDTNLVNSSFVGSISKGDYVLLSRVVSEVSQYKKYALEGEKKYYNVPVMQVLGKFKNNTVSFETFNPLFDKLVIKKIKVSDGLLETPDDNSMVGEVVKVGSCKFDKNWNAKPLQVKVGDIVLIRDNVTTLVTLNNEIYHVTEESMVVGIFKDPDNLSLDNITIINDNILLKQYKPKGLLNSNLLITPDIDYEDLDYSDIHNRDLFKVRYLDKSLTQVNKNDIILINRDVTSYVYFGQEKFCITSGMDYVEAKIEE